jgi:phenylacetate-CoA ligase
VSVQNILLNQFLLRQNIYRSKNELDAYRFRLLRKQLLLAYRSVQFYKTRFDQVGVNPVNLKSVRDLLSYPVFNKDIIRSNDLINHNALIKYKFKSHTSGSTGQPMWTYYDFKSWIRKKYLVKARARMECGVKPNEKIVVFESVSQNYKDNTNILFKKFKSRYRVFSIFEPLQNSVQKLISFYPVVLYGSPSFLFQLGQYISKNNLKLPSVKRIFTSSEYLQETVREYIKEKFKADVYDVYGSTEFKEVAWECEKHEGYHINEDEVIVEILKDGKPAAPGIIGNIVITDLRNTVMPLIRYQMNDKGMLMKDKCSCGRTFSIMKPYAGRSSEYIVLPNDQILSPYLFTTSIEKIEGLLQYQIIQSDKNKLLVNIVSNSEYFKNVSESVKNILEHITNHIMDIEIKRKTQIDVEENGKFKVVKNLTLEQKELKL